MNKFAAIGATLGFVTLLTVTGCGRHGGTSPEWVVKMISKKLDLSEEQTDKLTVLKDELLEIKAEVHNGRDETRQKIVNMIGSDYFDQGEILDLVNKKQKQVDQYAPVVISKLAAFHNELTPEQREKLATLFEKHCKKKRHFRFFSSDK